MKTNSVVALVATSSIIMMVMLGVVTTAIFLDNRELRSDLRQLRHDLRSSEDTHQNVQDERDEAQILVEEQRLAVQRLEIELASVKASLPGNNTSTAAAEQKNSKATLIRAYLGNQFLASGWLLPSSNSEGATNSAAAPPLVLLDPLFKARLDAAMTNAARQAVPETMTVNYNTYPANYPYYNGYWPAVWYVGGTNNPRPPIGGRPPMKPPSQPQPESPPITGPFKNDDFYKPSQPPFLSPPRSWMDSGRSAGGFRAGGSYGGGRVNSGGFSGSRVNSGGFPASRTALPAR